ncbi:MAG: hypothetical protein ACI93T_002945, partial [Porticoccaceae bacterium]
PLPCELPSRFLSRSNFNHQPERSLDVFPLHQHPRFGITPVRYGNRMHRLKAVVVVGFALLMLPDSSFAQIELMKRIKKVTEVPVWQHASLGQKESRQVLWI